MEIRVLRYFLSVTREGSITKAAQVLHITQPTLSRQLAQLEDELGVKLFERGNQKFRLTNEGLLLRRRAEEILQLAEITQRELSEQEMQIEGIIHLGCGELASVELLAELCRAFMEKYPRIRFDFYTATADVVSERMERGLTDLGLLMEPVNMEKFEFVRLKARERFCVLMRADDPLATRENLSADDLQALPLCLPSRLNVQSELANWFGERFGSLNIAVTTNLIMNAAIVAMSGLAYPVGIDGTLPLRDSKKLVGIPLNPDLRTSIALAWKRNQPADIAIVRFIEFAKCFLGMNESCE